MTKKIIQKAMLLLFALMAGYGSVRAVDVELIVEGNSSEMMNKGYTKNGVTIVFARNGSTSDLAYSNNAIWMYRITSANLNNGKSGSTMTITSAMTITKVVISFSSDNKAVVDKSYFNSGSYVSSNTDTTTPGTWTGSTNSLVLMNKHTESTNSTIKIKKVVVTIQNPVIINLNEACTDGSKYYGTFSNSNPFVVPSDLTVSEITVANGKLQLADYATDDVVPANTGVMVSSATAGEHSVALSGQDGTSKLGTNNMLKASGNSGINAVGMSTAAPSCLYYRLTMHNGKTIGYYWGASNGGAFTLEANKAYLAVPQSQAREGFNFFDNDSQSIDGLIREANNNNSEVYDLQGRKTAVNSKLNKGIYIVNGKKVVK